MHGATGAPAGRDSGATNRGCGRSGSVRSRRGREREPAPSSCDVHRSGRWRPGNHDRSGSQGPYELRGRCDFLVRNPASRPRRAGARSSTRSPEVEALDSCAAWALLRDPRRPPAARGGRGSPSPRRRRPDHPGRAPDPAPSAEVETRPEVTIEQASGAGGRAARRRLDVTAANSRATGEVVRGERGLGRDEVPGAAGDPFVTARRSRRGSSSPRPAPRRARLVLDPRISVMNPSIAVAIRAPAGPDVAARKTPGKRPAEAWMSACTE